MFLSTEVWKPIPGFFGFCEASSLGRVRSVSRRVISGRGFRCITGRLLTPSLGPDGYYFVSTSSESGHRSLPLHRLIALAFKGPRPPGLQIRHLDGVKTNCRADNLEYGTALENWADRKEHGNSVAGLQNPNAKLTVAEINEIVKIGKSRPYAETGRLFGISDSHARSIILKG